MTLGAVLLVVVLAVFLFGCTVRPESTGGPPSAVPTSDPTDPDGDLLPILERPASEGAASWPDGLAARLVGVEQVPNGWGVDVPKSQAVVRLTVEVVNGGDAVLPLSPGTQTLTLLYGDLRAEARQEAGYSYDDPDEEQRKGLSREPGTRIPVGGKATFVESAVVPVDQLGELTVAVRLPAVEGIRETLYLTGARGMLRQVK
ncbi:hypothetical protein C1I95_28150 [Micromonospora craterilacus]|uniref:Uncharacterized protein n=1 Tax=Micromonospora craterilacus TaxID=1655439 RepID=A0A2W2DE63_9ACTN|nr:hypothetical protein C1I95_28150 [Micromonospora craterilacus]